MRYVIALTVGRRRTFVSGSHHREASDAGPTRSRTHVPYRGHWLAGRHISYATCKYHTAYSGAIHEHIPPCAKEPFGALAMRNAHWYFGRFNLGFNATQDSVSCSSSCSSNTRSLPVPPPERHVNLTRPPCPCLGICQGSPRLTSTKRPPLSSGRHPAMYAGVLHAM